MNQSVRNNILFVRYSHQWIDATVRNTFLVRAMILLQLIYSVSDVELKS